MFQLIPLNQISDIEIYMNFGKRTLAEIQKITGADYIINAGFYNMKKFAPVMWLKVNGNLLSTDKNTAFGYGWNNPGDFTHTKDCAGYNNYIRAVSMVHEGKPEILYYSSDVGGARGRTAIGIDDKNNLMLYCAPDTGNAKITPENLREYFIEMGAESAIMLDGGGSSEYYAQGEIYESPREVLNYICVYLKKTGETMKTVVLDAGHGTGTVNGSPDGEYKEEEFTFDMVKRVRIILNDYNINTILTRTTRSTVSLADRVKISNAQAANCFVSIHSNAAGGEGWSTARGFSVYTSAAGDTAGRNILAKNILKYATAENIILRSTAPKNSKLYVLVNTVAPACLVECGFHTNKEDTALLKTSEYRDKLARVISAGILEYINIPLNTETTINQLAKKVQEKYKLSDYTMEYMKKYEYAKDLLTRLAESK